jgi:4-oxalomesaconate hydratase
MKSTSQNIRRWILLLLVTLGLGFGPLAQAQTEKTGSAPAKPARDPVTDSAMIANSTAKPKSLRILVVGAHPADVFDQSGGTMAHHVQRGDWVGCAVMTTGVRVHDQVVANELGARKELPEEREMKRIMAERAEVKRKEIIKACSILGVKEADLHFLGADDAILLVNEGMIRQIARLIRELKPDVIITHYPFEDGGIGSAHALTAQMVVHAISVAGGVDPGDKNKPHNVAQVFFFGTAAASARTDLWGAQGGFYNDVFVDITDVAEKKVACLDALVSQGYAGAYARKRIETTDGSFGTKVHVPYAEGFITAYSSVHYYLPVSPISLEHSKLSSQETIDLRSYRVNVPLPKQP